MYLAPQEDQFRYVEAALAAHVATTAPTESGSRRSTDALHEEIRKILGDELGRLSSQFKEDPDDDVYRVTDDVALIDPATFDGSDLTGGGDDFDFDDESLGIDDDDLAFQEDDEQILQTVGDITSAQNVNQLCGILNDELDGYFVPTDDRVVRIATLLGIESTLVDALRSSYSEAILIVERGLELEDEANDRIYPYVKFFADAFFDGDESATIGLARKIDMAVRKKDPKKVIYGLIKSALPEGKEFFLNDYAFTLMCSRFDIEDGPPKYLEGLFKNIHAYTNTDAETAWGLNFDQRVEREGIQGDKVAMVRHLYKEADKLMLFLLGPGRYKKLAASFQYRAILANPDITSLEKVVSEGRIGSRAQFKRTRLAVAFIRLIYTQVTLFSRYSKSEATQATAALRRKFDASPLLINYEDGDGPYAIIGIEEAYLEVGPPKEPESIAQKMLADDVDNYPDAIKDVARFRVVLPPEIFDGEKHELVAKLIQALSYIVREIGSDHIRDKVRWYMAGGGNDSSQGNREALQVKFNLRYVDENRRHPDYPELLRIVPAEVDGHFERAWPSEEAEKVDHARYKGSQAKKARRNALLDVTYDTLFLDLLESVYLGYNAFSTKTPEIVDVVERSLQAISETGVLVPNSYIDSLDMLIHMLGSRDGVSLIEGLVKADKDPNHYYYPGFYGERIKLIWHILDYAKEQLPKTSPLYSSAQSAFSNCLGAIADNYPGLLTDAIREDEPPEDVYESDVVSDDDEYDDEDEEL